MTTILFTLSFTFTIVSLSIAYHLGKLESKEQLLKIINHIEDYPNRDLKETEKTAIKELIHYARKHNEKHMFTGEELDPKDLKWLDLQCQIAEQYIKDINFIKNHST